MEKSSLQFSKPWKDCAPTMTMLQKILPLLLLGALLGGARAADLEGAQWVWFTTDPKLAVSKFPEGSVYFRAAFTLPAKAVVKSANIALTADNLFVLSINGKEVGESTEPNAWATPLHYDIAKLLVPGRNMIAIEAVNTAPGPAGFIAKLVVQFADGSKLDIVSDGTWRANDTADLNWQQPPFDDATWGHARVLGPLGMGPWSRLAAAAKPAPAESSGATEVAAAKDFVWPEAVAFVAEDCSLYRPHGGTGTSQDSLGVTIFNPRDSRAFPEHDLPAPMKVGHKLMVLRPAQPGVKPQVLLDAGKGALGSPTVSFDGRWLYVSMAREGEGFFHIYRVRSDGSHVQRLTDGPFHDIDPAELADGRIVFTSTRIGTFEEYHNPPSRSLFTMTAEGRDIRPLTHTFIFDNEPEVLADGRILFIRSDNFFDRGKVETMLHAIHPDGTEGYTEFALDNGPEYGGRLRAFNCGSPAPMPDGRVAFLTGSDIAIGHPGATASTLQHLRVAAGDVAALPDGRLLCTTARVSSYLKTVKKKQRAMQSFSYEKIGIVDPRAGNDRVTVFYDSPDAPLHSPVFLGARPRPPLLPPKVDAHKTEEQRPTGILFCQNARFTKNTTAGWPHIRAIRVLAGSGLTLRSSHSYIVHAGSDVAELGTVPLAPDGSFAIEVPADTASAFHAVDGEGRSGLNEMSWIFVRPGEKRGCVGCHQPRQVTPPTAPALIQALHTPPLKLTETATPHRFRGNNPAVTGLMELQFDRYREVASLNRHGDLADPLATGAQEVAALIVRLRSGSTAEKITAAQRLAIFRDQAAAPALAEGLKQPQRELRLAIAFALAACGTRDSVPPLLAMLDDPDPLVVGAVGIALENLTGHSLEMNNTSSTTGQTGAYLEVRGITAWRGWFQTNAWDNIERELVARLSSDNRDVVRRAAVALGHNGGEAARVALRACVTRADAHNVLPEWRKTHQGDGTRFNSLDAVNPRSPQAVIRALGYLRDAAAVPLLADILKRHGQPVTGNLFLAEAAAEALGMIPTPEAETALINAFAALGDYPHYTSWYGDHGALMACHSSPIHYFIAEALDARGATKAAAQSPRLIESVPTDFDRALMPGNDDYETIIGRVIRRNDPAATVVTTCLATLGLTNAAPDTAVAAAIAKTHGAWGGKATRRSRRDCARCSRATSRKPTASRASSITASRWCRCCRSKTGCASSSRARWEIWVMRPRRIS
ncbi:MAG: HEAT repeat domain-containing protein [Kiritimatiellaeota bacterium]|nr:HEAT repeat domain-containing protein [Kiritimatiellota bacterium]